MEILSKLISDHVLFFSNIIGLGPKIEPQELFGQIKGSERFPTVCKNKKSQQGGIKKNIETLLQNYVDDVNDDDGL